MSEHIDLPGLPGGHATRAAEIIHAQVHYDTPPEVTSCATCHDAADSLNDHGLLVTPAHDAEQQRIGAEAALAYVKTEALDPRQAATEGPLVGRILVAHWCDKAASTGAGGFEREGGSDV